MRVTKNGICREIDPKRAQEFREKGYTFEGDRNDDNVELLKRENEALKQKNETLKAEIEALLKSQVETLNPQVGGEENGENGESGESEQTSTDEKSEKAGKAEATARAKK